MAVKDKVFYWIKLKTEFMNGDVVDFLMSQKDGANYVVLYEMLCIKAINTKGKLATEIGEVLVPFDIDKIQRECKWFSRDTIVVAMELYKKLGLICEQQDGVIVISNFDGLVGNETYWTRQKRLANSKKKENEEEKSEEESVGISLENFQHPLNSISNSNTLNSNSFKSNSSKSKNSYNIQEMIDNYNFTNNINNIIPEWIKYKKEKRQSYTETGFKALLEKVKKDFEKYGEKYVLSEFEHSMANNYDGLFPPKENSQNAKVESKEETTIEDMYDWVAKATKV